jgi:hypothetical protein
MERGSISYALDVARDALPRTMRTAKAAAEGPPMPDPLKLTGAWQRPNTLNRSPETLIASSPCKRASRGGALLPVIEPIDRKSINGRLDSS